MSRHSRPLQDSLTTNFKLIATGLIIVGKANLSVSTRSIHVLTKVPPCSTASRSSPTLGNRQSPAPHTGCAILTGDRGSNTPSAWSAVGGQVQSAYIVGGVDPNDSKDGHTVSVGPSQTPIYTLMANEALEPLGVFLRFRCRSFRRVCAASDRHRDGRVPCLPRRQSSLVRNQTDDWPCSPRWNCAHIQ